jgi:hypothetical protein
MSNLISIFPAIVLEKPDPAVSTRLWQVNSSCYNSLSLSLSLSLKGTPHTKTVTQTLLILLIAFQDDTESKELAKTEKVVAVFTKYQKTNRGQI